MLGIFRWTKQEKIKFTANYLRDIHALTGFIIDRECSIIRLKL